LGEAKSNEKDLRKFCEGKEEGFLYAVVDCKKLYIEVTGDGIYD
jgi:hypothetical protein